MRYRLTSNLVDPEIACRGFPTAFMDYLANRQFFYNFVLEIPTVDLTSYKI